MAIQAESSPSMAAEPDSPFLSILKDGELVESMCLHGLDSIVLGRHTNCDLMVTHPSVSRHHLEIQVLHGSRRILLTDLDSIHGTWMNGKQVLPLIPVMAKEGDTIKLGASSRLYSVQWRPHPPQNSSSSEDYSDNSDSHVYCAETKEQSAAESKLMESRKPLQEASGKPSQPECTLKSNDKNKQKTEISSLGEIEIVGGSLVDNIAEVCSSSTDACTGNENLKMDSENCQNKFEYKQQYVEPNLQVEQLFMENCANTTFKQEYLVRNNLPLEQSFMETSENVMPPTEETGVVSAKEICLHGVGCEGMTQESKLWLRRCKLNPPPPRLLTSTSPSSVLPSPLQEKIIFAKNTNSSVPSAPPMPLSYLIHNVVPSAPLLPSVKYVTQVDKKKSDELTANTNECTICDAGIDCAKENMYPSTLGREDACVVEKHGEMAKEYVLDKENDSSVLGHSSMCGEGVPAPVSDAEVVEEYVSDKENNSPVFGHDCKLPKPNNVKADGGITERIYTSNTEASRRPFQPLVLIADGGCNLASSSASKEDNSVTQTKSRQSPVVQNLDLMLRKLKGMARSEPRRSWHIVVDITCLLDSNSLKSLRHLEGLREVRLIIPKIVISELDCRRGIGRPGRKALKWIESCMVKLPSWIHVQSSSENLPVAATPPVSPLSARSIYGGSLETVSSPTNGDHVLSCALLFSNMIFNGQIALLTNNIALKIKAMAEGLVCESPSGFCESLLSPYSDRFLWAASTAHGHSWTEKPCHMKSASNLAPGGLSADQSTKESVMSTMRAMAFKKNHAVEGLKRQCIKQAQGLRVALTD